MSAQSSADIPKAFVTVERARNHLHFLIHLLLYFTVTSKQLISLHHFVAVEPRSSRVPRSRKQHGSGKNLRSQLRDPTHFAMFHFHFAIMDHHAIIADMDRPLVLPFIATSDFISV